MHRGVLGKLHLTYMLNIKYLGTARLIHIKYVIALCLVAINVIYPMLNVAANNCEIAVQQRYSKTQIIVTQLIVIHG